METLPTLAPILENFAEIYQLEISLATRGCDFGLQSFMRDGLMVTNFQEFFFSPLVHCQGVRRFSLGSPEWTEK